MSQSEIPPENFTREEYMTARNHLDAFLRNRSNEPGPEQLTYKDLRILRARIVQLEELFGGIDL